MLHACNVKANISFADGTHVPQRKTELLPTDGAATITSERTSVGLFRLASQVSNTLAFTSFGVWMLESMLGTLDTLASAMGLAYRLKRYSAPSAQVSLDRSILRKRKLLCVRCPLIDCHLETDESFIKYGRYPRAKDQALSFGFIQQRQKTLNVKVAFHRQCGNVIIGIACSQHHETSCLSPWPDNQSDNAMIHKVFPQGAHSCAEN